MTDNREPVAPEQPVPSSSPSTPTPLPAPDVRKRVPGRAAAWITVAIVGVAAVVCGLSYLAARALFDGAGLDSRTGEDAGWGAAALQTPGSVWWSGNGRFVVLQATGEDDVQEVVVHDLTSGKTRTLKGYRAVGVEPHAPRLWLVPDKRVMGVSYSSEATPQVTDIAWDGIDSPPSELLALRLDRTEDPRADVDARWTPWAGAAGYAASVEIDVNKGGCPGTIRFSKVGSSLNAWSAKVPTDVVTFEPIGWSPSGAYFAVISQLGPAGTQELDSRFLEAAPEAVSSSLASETAELSDAALGAGRPVAEAIVVVFSAKDGTVASRAPIRVPVRDPNSGPARAVWSAAEDVLTLLTLASSGSADDEPVLLGLTPGAAPVAIETSPTPWADGAWSGLWIAGSDGTSALVASGLDFDPAGYTDVYGVDRAGGVRHLGMTLGGAAARWSPVGGLLSLQEYQTDGEWRVFRSTAGGGQRAEVLSAPGPIFTDISD